MSEETRRADNLAYEMKKLEEKHETVLKEKEVTAFEMCQIIYFFTLAVLTFFTNIWTIGF